MSFNLNRRPEWESLPFAVKDEAERRLGSPVLSAQTQPGGFTSGVASILTLNDDTTVFMKALSVSDDMAEWYRSEAAVSVQLPEAVPSPRLRFSFELEGWITLVFDAIDGGLPHEPWRDDELGRVVSTISDMSNMLTPSPVDDIPRLEELLQDEFDTFRRLLHDRQSGLLTTELLDPEVRTRLPHLAVLEAQWERSAAGNTLTHLDLRADNFVFGSDGKVWVVDWSMPCSAAPWVDLATFLPTVDRRSDELNDLFLSSAVGEGAVPADVNAFLAGLAGMWLERGCNPPLPHAPHIREHQTRCAHTTLDWLSLRELEGH